MDQRATPFDLVIRGGTLADGSGAPLREADVGIRGERIVAVDARLARGTREIDARGRLVTPGFVDIHSHYDGQACWDPHLWPSSQHGVTTAVMGNCGVGFAPVHARDHDRLIELMEGVEDIPGVALQEGLRWNWESFADYLDAIDALPRDIDIAAQLPHAALRLYVMGDRAVALEDATPDEIARMRSLARDAMAAGALGFSSSRSLNHRTVGGDPTPTLRATEAELTGIAQGLADAGRGVLQFISDFAPDGVAEFDMLKRVARTSGRPISISLAQRPATPTAWRQRLELIEQANREGIAFRAQVAPRPVGVLFGLMTSRNPLSDCPSFVALAALSLEEKVAAMRDPALRARILAEAAHHVPEVIGRRGLDFRFVFPLGDPPDYEPPAERSIAAIAKRTGVEPIEAAYDALLARDGRELLLYPFANYADGNLDACGEMLAHPHTVPGLADGGAHVGLICDGSFPTYTLAHWGRDRSHGRLPVERLVEMLTSRSAAAVGLLDRGLVATGYKADLNIIDMDRLAIEPPEIRFDLPAGGRRFHQRARGYEATVVSGQVSYVAGEPTGVLAGRLVRSRLPVEHR
ncbi:MAG: amidohydrolase family protein [Burkholderiaceae bacterium]|nr:amidohydrolase family protein [Burkholderiaceae bacterium]